jgi:flavorubredoxin
MRTFIEALTERGFQNKTVALIENGSWASTAGNVMKKMLEKSKNITFTENNIKIKSAMNEENINQIKALAKELA